VDQALNGRITGKIIVCDRGAPRGLHSRPAC
jgi:hypothetical protein